MASRVDLWREAYPLIRDDPFYFFQLLNFEPTSYQAEVTEDVKAGKPRVAVKSGQGPGKTAMTVGLAMWRTMRAFKAMTLLTAPSIKQCRDVFLAECARALDKAHPILKQFINVKKSRVEFGGVRDWEIKVSTASKSSNISGYHQDNLTVIIEEAQGVGADIFQTCQGTLTNQDSLLLAIGNPTTTDCAFYDCFGKARDDWACHTFNGEDAARDYPHIVSPERNEILARQFGRDSDVYRVRVLGEFPSNNPRSIIGLGDAEAAEKAPMFAALMRGGLREKAFGIDLAAYGEDESVIVRRQGNAIVERVVYRQKDPAWVVRQAFKMQSAVGWRNEDCVFVFDVGGMGAGVRHLFDERGCDYIPFAHNGTAIDSREYADKISEAMFELGKLLRQRGGVHLGKDPVLVKQLCGRHYDLDPRGRLRAEPKKVYCHRTKEPSPDRADAVAMAFYPKIMGTGMLLQAARRTKRVGDF
jgi:phage terminase large subunit